MKVVILGCGRVGAQVALTLATAHDITVIDWNQGAFERLGENFLGQTLVGNGIDIEVLRQSRVSDADFFVAVTDGDNRNLMACQVAQQLGVPKALARVYDAEREQCFTHTGFTTISPTVTGAERIFQMLVGSGREA